MGITFIEKLYTAGETLLNKSIRLIGGKDSSDIVRPITVDNHGRLLITGGSAGTDAFGNFRTVEPRSLFEVKHNYDKFPATMIENIIGTGTSTWISNDVSVRLRVSANGDKVTRRSRYYIPYEPGRAQKALLTGVMGSDDANVIKRVGLFDDNDGFFFRKTSTGMAVVERSSTSGSANDNFIIQANWNIDKLDGSGPSGISVDFSKGQIFIIEYAWLGYGIVRYGIDIGGELFYCHQITHENTQITGPRIKE